MTPCQAVPHPLLILKLRWGRACYRLSQSVAVVVVAVAEEDEEKVRDYLVGSC